MKRIKLIIMLAVMALCSQTAMAQRHDFANYAAYAKANQELGAPKKGEKRVVFMGNSITQGWPAHRPEWFKENDFIGRGIGGQTSYQFVLRFHEDVINLQPKVVVINYGTNDIAENTGAYNEDYTFNNVKAMVEMARYNKIKVILTSCLPHKGFGWRPEIKDAMQKIQSLNERVKAYAKAEKIPYVDYYSAMLAEDGQGMPKSLAADGVHPNADGYKIMEALVLPVIKKLRK